MVFKEILDLFREDEETRLGRERQRARDEERLEQRENEELRINAALAKVRFFPGSKEEYEGWVGHKVRIIDTGRRDAGLLFRAMNGEYEVCGDFKLKERLVLEGIEAIINCGYSAFGTRPNVYHTVYGLPVANIVR